MSLNFDLKGVNMDCIFCKIIAREIPAEVVGENEGAIAFHDIAPEYPVHILVVPREHHENVADLSFANPEALVHVIQLGSKLAREHSTGSFKLTFNTGVEAGQTVFHAHGHVTSTTPKDF